MQKPWLTAAVCRAHHPARVDHTRGCGGGGGAARGSAPPLPRAPEAEPSPLPLLQDAGESIFPLQTILIVYLFLILNINVMVVLTLRESFSSGPWMLIVGKVKNPFKLNGIT